MTVTEEFNVADSAEKTEVGVLDKSVAVIDLVERGPATLVEMGAELGSSTIHRLANALTKHGFVRRGLDGRTYPGRRFSQAALVDTARAVLTVVTRAWEQIWLHNRRRLVGSGWFDDVMHDGSVISIGQHDVRGRAMFLAEDVTTMVRSHSP